MSTRCSIIYDYPFHLFEESNDNFKLTLSIYGKENEYSEGIYLSKEDLVKFAKQVIEWSEKGVVNE